MSAFALTPPAEERPAQVVGVDTPTLVGGGAGLQDGLDAGEELRRHEWLMPAEEPLIVIGDEP